MSSAKACFSDNRVLITIIALTGWMVAILCWLAFGWGQYSLIQNLVSLMISALVFAAVVGAVWAAELGFAPTATILAALGWLSFTLYWFGFGWHRHTLLQNTGVLFGVFLFFTGMVIGFWLVGPTKEY